MRILVVEDDPSVAQILKILLVSHNYAVEIATDGEMGLNLAEAFEYDLILLDILLPKLDGISLCKALRARGHRMPILLLTGQGGSYEKVVGLDTGADDYVVKPFDHEELIARIRALLRRGHISSQPILEWGELRLDPSSREVTYSSHALTLTPKEYALVEMFLRSPRLTFSLNMILEHLWTFEEAPSEDAIRVHMKTLRQKLKAAGAPIDLIETVYGIGYRLNPARMILPATEMPAEASPVTTAITTAITAVQDQTQNQPQASASLLPAGSTPEIMPKIMIVAQKPDLRSQLATMLSNRGWQISTIASPQNWQTLLERNLPHLLILDADLPASAAASNGIEHCQLIRQSDRWQKLPILLITPSADADQIQRLFAAGASDFVSQPIAGPELLSRVEVHLEKAQLQEKIAALEAQVNPTSLLIPLPEEPDRPDWLHWSVDRFPFSSNF